MTRTIPARLTAADPDPAPTPAPTLEHLIADAVGNLAATTPTPTPDPAPPPVPATPAPVVDAAATPPPAPAGVPTTATAAAPAGSITTRPRVSVRAAAELVAAGVRGGHDAGRIVAALADLTPGGTTAAQPGTMPDTWLGQLWNGVAYRRRMVDAITRGPAVTSLNVKGWRWTTPPTVAAYGGNKAAIPSNQAKTEAVTVPVQRYAGGHDIDRAYFDLADPDYVAGYWQAMTESYAAQSDAGCAAAIVADAPSAGTSRTALGAIVKAALAVVPVAPPTFVAIASDVFEDLANTSEKDALAFLTGALRLDGTGDLSTLDLFVSPHIPAGTVVAGVRQAATFHELDPALRVSVANVANGGIDAALFGYAATVVHNDGGLAKVTHTPAATRSK